MYKYSVPNCSKEKVKAKTRNWVVVSVFLCALLDEAPAKYFNQVDLNRKIVYRTELMTKLKSSLFKSIFIKISHFEMKTKRMRFNKLCGRNLSCPVFKPLICQLNLDTHSV